MDNRVRSFINADGKEIHVVDRQARHWFFILYSDNESHLKALEKFKQDVHSLILCHDRSYDPTTGELKKKHWHCIYRNFNQSDRTYMFTVLDSIGLDVSNAHLFRTIPRNNIHGKTDIQQIPVKFGCFVCFFILNQNVSQINDV